MSHDADKAGRAEQLEVGEFVLLSTKFLRLFHLGRLWLTVIGWPTDMMDSSRTTVIRAVEGAVGDKGPAMATRSRVSSRGA